MTNSLESRVIDEGKKLFTAINTQKESFFDKNALMGRFMDYVMKDPKFKVDLFRFVDVLPTLKTKEQLAKHVQEYLLQEGRNIPAIMGTALKAASFSLTKGLAFSAIKKNVTGFASRFIVGSDLSDAKKNLQKLSEGGFSFTIDLLGEATLSEKEADEYAKKYQEIICNLPSILNGSDQKDRYLDPLNVSIKVSALSSQIKEEAKDSSIQLLLERVLPLLRLAKEKNVFINFDLESFKYHEITNDLFCHILALDEFKDWPHLGIVVQAYLKESERHLDRLIDLAQQRKVPFAIRLVKGAYWDYEVVHAKKLNIDCPVFLQKALSDQQYEKLSRKLLDHHHLIRPAFASHNLRSLAHALAYAKEKNVSKASFEIQMLYGMAEQERKALLQEGFHVRIYTPMGEMLPGMSYLVRRLLENTSQMGFLRLRHQEEKSQEQLLAKPAPDPNFSIEAQKTFVNHSMADFTKINQRQLMKEAIKNIEQQLPFEISPKLNSEKISCEKTLEHFCPSDKKILLAKINCANGEHVNRAVDKAHNSFAALKKLGLKERAAHLEKLATLLERDLYFFAALICFEVGKSWFEAIADVSEAIDFCRYYKECAISQLSSKKIGEIEGENNTIHYQGRGVSVIIAPWNFPLAILCGMSVAAYVCGNPIVLKPAEQSSTTANFLFDRMIEAGFLESAIHFMPGIGEEIGPLLVEHKNVANICFTGSKAVGHEIMRRANTIVENQLQMKRVICEMGGKNAIIIDDDADLDEAVYCVLHSAFSYAGQKCSAASRLIVLESVKEIFLERLTEGCKSLKVGVSMDPKNFMGPVVDQVAQNRLLKKIEQLKNDRDVIVHYESELIPQGFFVPKVLAEVKHFDHWLFKEELFGPILGIYFAKDLDQALNVANNSDYALTGGFFSRSPKNIERVFEEFDVGNLYINDKCTGALVNRQPFGGFKMSGTGIKAGGSDYLKNFVDSKIISENTMRRGFTPEVSI